MVVSQKPYKMVEEPPLGFPSLCMPLAPSQVIATWADKLVGGMTGLSEESPMTLPVPPFLTEVWTVNKLNCDNPRQEGTIKLVKRWEDSPIQHSTTSSGSYILSTIFFYKSTRA